MGRGHYLAGVARMISGIELLYVVVDMTQSLSKFAKLDLES